MAVIYEWLLEARVFFQPCLMIAGKTGAYLREAPFKCSTIR
jgi:hypothetical protein